MTKAIFPDYTNSLVNVSNSIIKHYGLTPYHKTLPELDLVLKKNYRNVVFMFFDAMGIYNLEMCLPPNSFLRSHVYKQITSVYPPTTVAATTALYSGLEPCESGWLGWTQYFSEVDKNDTVFLNTDDDGNKISNYPDESKMSIAQKYCPFKPVVQQINEQCKNCNNKLDTRVEAHAVSPFGDVPYSNFDELFTTIETYCSKPGRHYLECYNNQPDFTMHEKGVDSKEVKLLIEKIDKSVEKMCKTINERNPGDTVFIICADHGHINSEVSVITDYPEIMACLKRLPSLESRTPTFFVKDGMHKEFCELFKHEFGNDFILLTKQEVLDKHIFGNGGNEALLKKQFTDKKNYEDFIGDYVAFATGNRTLFNSKKSILKGVHAGFTREEIMIPLIIV
ncbi:MAG: hypothetical protein BKP49_06165 [Treponema sp. CETP13]|nr:MAG: hypothetical protein BKP49_06165 [Treponema sp. CETP13]